MKPNKKQLIATLLLAIVFGLFSTSQILTMASPFLIWVLVFILSIVAWAGAFYFLGIKFVNYEFSKYERKSIIFLSLVCMAAGFFLVVTIPLTVFPKVTTIKIIATGEKQPNSFGSEVWLAQIAESTKSSSITMDDRCSDNWVEIDDLLVSSLNQPSEITCTIKTEKGLLIIFGTHPWSGFVEVQANNQTFTRDLYGNSGNLEVVNIDLRLTDKEKVFYGLFFIADGLSLGLILLVVALWLLRKDVNRKLGSSTLSRSSWIINSVILIIVWGFFLVIFWPGFLSPDGVTQLSQVVSGKYYNWHPAFHTLTLWLLTRLSLSPAPIAIFHILSLGILLGLGISYVVRDLEKNWSNYSLVGFYALFPPVCLMVLTIWKDVLYSISLTALTIILFRIISTDGKWLTKSINWIALGFTCALVMLFRHNGWMPVVGSLVVLFFAFYKRYKKYIFGGSLVLIFLWYGITGPLYSAVGVNTTDLKYGKNQAVPNTMNGLLFKHLNAETKITSGEEYFFTQGKIGEVEVDQKFLNDHITDLVKLSFKLTWRNPLVTVDFLTSKTNFVFQIRQPSANRYETIGGDIVDNPFDITASSSVPGIKAAVKNLISITEQPEYDWFFWRNAFWMYLLIFAVVIAIVRTKSWKYVLLVLPVIFNALPLAVFSGGQLSRYILPTLIISPLFIFYLALKKPLNVAESEVK